MVLSGQHFWTGIGKHHFVVCYDMNTFLVLFEEKSLIIMLTSLHVFIKRFPVILRIRLTAD